MITLVLGGARSGKSSFAEKLAEKRGGDNVVYLATAEPKDKEMEERINHHKENRPDSWETIEEPLSVGEVLASLSPGKMVLLDCITVLISNLLFAAGEGDLAGQREKVDFFKKEEMVIGEMEKIVEAADDKELIIVSNEVGMGIVPAHRLGRGFRDIAGRANQYLAEKADKVYLTVAGLPVELKELSQKLT